EWTLAHLQELLETNPSTSLKILGIPDRRTQPAIQLLLAQSHAVRVGVHPEAVWSTSEQAGYSATLRASHDDGTFDALLTPISGSAEASALYEPALVSTQLETLASNPLRSEMKRKLEMELHAHI